MKYGWSKPERNPYASMGNVVRHHGFGVQRRDFGQKEGEKLIEGEQDKVSIIIPTYNRPDLLHRALATAVGQTYGNIEIIVVDDCSSLDITPFIKGFADNRIRLIRQERNQGAPKARNTGVENASGKYIAFLDDDDEFFPEKIELQMADLERKAPRYKVSFCLRQLHFEDRGEMVPTPPGWDGNHLEEALAGENVPSTSSVLLEKECLEKLGGFRTDLPCFQDWELWIRLAEKYEFAYVNKVLLTMHLHNKGRISSDHSKRMMAYPIIYEAHKDLIKRNRKAHSLFLRRYAFHCVDVGQSRQAKKLFAKSLILNPFEARSYLTFALLMTNRLGKRL